MNTMSDIKKAEIISDSIFDVGESVTDTFEIESLGLNFDGYLNYLTFDKDIILKRQAVFKDTIASDEVGDKYAELLSRIDQLEEFIRSYGSPDSNEEIIYSIIEIRSFCEVINYITEELIPLVDKGVIKAESVASFLKSAKAFSETQNYRDIAEWIENIDKDLKYIRSVTLGANIDSMMRITEVGIVSMNKHPYVGGGLIKAVFGDEKVPGEYKVLKSLGIKETKKLLGYKSIKINNEFFGAVNDMFKSNLKSIREDILAVFKQSAVSVLSVGRDLRFIMRVSEYINNIRQMNGKLVFPEVSEHTEIKGLYHPDILKKAGENGVVKNDVYLDGSNNGVLLIGPNSGGKTVYVDSVGIAQLLFQLGLPVPADEALMCPHDYIGSITVRDSEHNSDGRLASEVKRLKRCLEDIKDHKSPLLLLDETFSGTSAYDGEYLAQSLIKYLSRKNCIFLYITHFHELVNSVKAPNVRVMYAESVNGVRTYRIVPYSPDTKEGSLAKDVLIENGLEFIFTE